MYILLFFSSFIFCLLLSYVLHLLLIWRYHLLLSTLLAYYSFSLILSSITFLLFYTFLGKENCDFLFEFSVFVYNFSAWVAAFFFYLSIIFSLIYRDLVLNIYHMNVYQFFFMLMYILLGIYMLFSRKKTKY